MHHGDELESPRIAFRLDGAANAPVVAALGGISAHRLVAGAKGEAWWSEIVGPGLALDTLRFRVLGIDYIGGTGDSSTSDGAHAFPPVSAYDQAEALAEVVRHLGLEISACDRRGLLRRHGRARVCAAPCGARRTHRRALRGRPLAGAFDRVALRPAPNRARSPRARRRTLGTAARARLGDDDLSQRLGICRTLRLGAGPRSADRFRFPVEDYLFARGDDYIQRYRPESFLDAQRIDRPVRMDARQVRTPATLLAVRQDLLVPFADMQRLAGRLGGPRRLIEIDSIFGHDAFLKEGAALKPIFKQAVTEATK